MSGLAGVLHRDDRPAQREMIDNMVQSMHYRGPDGMDVWSSVNVLLGQCTLRSGSFSHSAIAINNPSDERYVIVGDIRIDNREQLLSMCGHPGPDHPASTSDLSLVRLLYERQGDAFINNVEGDFAFALYDIIERRVRCYRDHFGTRPFYYFLDRELFVFASDIKAILATGVVDNSIDQTKLEDYLVGSLADEEKTFYKNIRRLQAGSLLEVGPDTVSYRTYWTIDGERSLRDTDEALVHGFRERFLDAVKSRLSDSGQTAFMLSGGLDSSSVVASAAHVATDRARSFKTYSVEFPYLPENVRARTDERRYVDDVVASTGVIDSRLTGETETPLSTLSTMLGIQDEPFLVPNAYLDAIALSAVHKDGCSVLLTGLEGDLTISHGDGYLNELGFRGQWDSFARESRALAARTGSEPGLFLDRYGMPTLEQLAQSGEWAAFHRGVKALSREFNEPSRGMYWSLGARPYLANWYRKVSHRETLDEQRTLRFVKKTYPQRGDICQRIAESSFMLSSARSQSEHHIAQLKSGYPASLLEFAEKNAAHWQIDVRHPFFDRRLVEYSVALPGSTKLSDGWARYILRASMEQILPDSVRWRAQKAALGPNFAYLMAKESEDNIRALAETAIEAFPYIIEKASVSSFLDRRKYATLWRILVLGGWILHKRS